MKKKILAWALLICLLATLRPVSAFAEGEIAEDVPAEPVGADAPGGPEPGNGHRRGRVDGTRQR